MFLHGLMGSAMNWRQIARAFEDEFHILIFDQRGHGRSFQPPDGYHPRDFAQDLKLILDELGWDQIALIGHSMGGRNALEFAFHFSQRVKALVIEDIGPEADSGAIERIERLLSLVPTPFQTREDVRDFFTNTFPGLIGWYGDAPTVSRFLHTNIEQKPDGTHDWRFARHAMFQSMREGRQEDRWDAFRNLKMPVLVIRGENSTTLSRETFARMSQVLPAGRFVEIPRSGHWVHFEQPEAFTNAVKEFFHTVFGSKL